LAGDLLECPECGESLEIISVEPLELETAFGVEETEFFLGPSDEGDWDWEEESEEDEEALEFDLEEEEPDEPDDGDGDL